MLAGFKYRTKLTYRSFASARNTLFAQLVLVVLLGTIGIVGLCPN